MAIITNLLFTSGKKHRPALWLVLSLLSQLPSSFVATASTDNLTSPTICIVDIQYIGNSKTKTQIINRQLQVKAGQCVSQAQLKQAEQRVKNLGLFRTVELHVLALNLTEHLLTVQVKEKRYLIAYPRLSFNADQEAGYGATGVWSNIGGLNHKAKASYIYNQRKQEGFSDQRKVRAKYYAPLVVDHWDFSSEFSIEETPFEGEIFVENYNETQHRVELDALYRWRSDDAANGIKTSLGVEYWRFAREYPGDGTKDYDKYTVVINTSLSNREIDFLLYSDIGHEWSVRYEQSLPINSSDSFSYNQFSASYTRYFPGIGGKEHHNYIISADIDILNSAPQEYEEHSTSSSVLRGFGKDHAQGNAFFSIRNEYLFPTPGQPALRWFVHLDTGMVVKTRTDFNFEDIDASLGLGMRWRPKWFVNLELDIGLSYAFTGEGFKGTGGTRRLGD